ncbi:MAG: hypothetical protein ACLFPQ_02155 [Candidatus Woesearchaeota archaeon]
MKKSRKRSKKNFQYDIFQVLKEIFSPDKAKLITSALIFILFLISFFIFSSVLLKYCGQTNPAYLDICLDMQKEYYGDSIANTIKISFILTIVSFPIVAILPGLGIQKISPFLLWLIAIASNLLYVYVLSCMGIFAQRRLFPKNNPEKKNKTSGSKKSSKSSYSKKKNKQKIIS